jgi:hypothetical protein
MPDLKEFGSTGLQRFGGVIYDEYLRELQGVLWQKTVREMVDDATIAAILYAIEMLLRQVRWDVQPGSDDQLDVDAAAFIEQCFDDMSYSWEDTLSEILTMLPWGWSYMEMVYKVRGGPDGRDPKRRSKYSDGRIGWRKWSIRAQETKDRWEFDDEGGIQGMWQTMDSGKSVLIPIDKSLLFRTSIRKGSPEGRSILRSCYRAWYYRRHIENIEGIGIERDLAGLPVAGVPARLLSSNATSEEKALLTKIKDIVTNIRRDEQEGVVWPLSYDDQGREIFRLQLLSSGGSRQFDTNVVIARYDQRITMAVLADFMLLGSGSTGSWALSADKSSLFKTALEAYLSSIAAVINTHAIPKLLRLNKIRYANAPTYEPGRVGTVDLGVVVDFVDKMAKAGMELFPNMDLENHLRGEAGLPVLDDEQMADREQRSSRNLAAALLTAQQDGQDLGTVDRTEPV